MPVWSYSGSRHRCTQRNGGCVSTETESLPVGKARALVPSIIAEADRIEREQRVPDHLVEALTDAGLFKLLAPLGLGGTETDLVTYARTIEVLAAADASLAWCVAQASPLAMRMPWADPEIARAILTPRLAVLASGTASAQTRAVAAPGGYRVTGEWRFGSGGHHSTWMLGEVRVYGLDGSPELLSDGRPRTTIVTFPQSVVTWHDAWQVSGLRGTGSDTYAVTDLFVPDEQVIDVTLQPRTPSKLNCIPIRAAHGAGFAAVACGIVRVMLDTFEDVAQGKTPKAGMTVLRENAVVQSQVGRAEAILGAARAYLHETLQEAWEFAGTHGELDLALRVQMRLANTHALQEAARAGDMMHMAAGSTAVFQSSPFERRFRDLHAATAQVQAQQLHYETAGQFFLGIDPDRAWI